MQDPHLVALQWIRTTHSLRHSDLPLMLKEVNADKDQVVTLTLGARVLDIYLSELVSIITSNLSLKLLLVSSLCYSALQGGLRRIQEGHHSRLGRQQNRREHQLGIAFGPAPSLLLPS